MSVVWGGIAVLVLLSVLALARTLRRLVFVFAVVVGALLILHGRENPGEAAAAGAVMVAGLRLARPLQRILIRGLF
ncbi:MnhB domain-containing protein [Rhodalgimonas zhirmunskyi]|uniref:Na+/H+ antiporter MnhB subunit-related protein domain-containing protein n=1 Tax=Rhodalgimonas zhirmunskyi TaxID=2964767 RepID=A0AAJ1UDE1_9RHOB|nr:MnhB domain-containing protein [Rhodoalgimonas zhirmunskyi]MDQ2095463.1 hypothetical protein [Rhodoalgimonas zhirmunskyi]